MPAAADGDEMRPAGAGEDWLGVRFDTLNRGLYVVDDVTEARGTLSQKPAPLYVDFAEALQ